MTKEAKLTAAVRILPEWKGYDDEIRKLQKKIDSGLLDADPAETNEGKYYYSFIIYIIYHVISKYSSRCRSKISK